jgi:hypothetical protein
MNYNIFKFISESVISNRYYDEEVLKEFIFNENVIKSKKQPIIYYMIKNLLVLSIIYLDTHLQFSCIKYLDDTIAYFKLIYGFDEKAIIVKVIE